MLGYFLIKRSKKAGKKVFFSANTRELEVPKRAEITARVATILRPVVEKVAENYFQQVNKGFRAWQVRI